MRPTPRMLRTLIVGALIALTCSTLRPASADPSNAAPVALGSAGSLDSSFGTGGIVTTDLGPEAEGATAIALQPDGKIVAAGVVGYGGAPAIVRYNANGTLDDTFGDGGVVVSDAGRSGVNAMALQPDGKIVVAGGNARFVLIRFTPEGDLDPTFGGDGIVKTNFHRNYDIVFALAIQSDGRIVAAGVSSIVPRELGLDDTKVAVARYEADGSLDTSFGRDGRVATYFTGTYNAARAVAIQADGKIVAAGTANGYRTFALVRYMADGTLDRGFGESGRVVTNFDRGSIEILNALALQADGKIVAVGQEPSGVGFALARYEPDGDLDLTFGIDGTVLTPFLTRNDFGYVSGGARGVAIQSDGKIVVGGAAPPESGGDTDFALARYLVDGSLDPMFGREGKVLTVFSKQGNDAAFGTAIQPNGRIVAAGTTDYFGPGATFALARYLP